MPKFIVRVELHEIRNKDHASYKALHAAMEAEDFSRTITSDDGAEYHLPHATYYRASGERKEVLSLAKKAAATADPSYETMIIESNGMMWAGLKPVKTS